jgi:hypothetical protein
VGDKQEREHGKEKTKQKVGKIGVSAWSGGGQWQLVFVEDRSVAQIFARANRQVEEKE